MRLRWWRRGRAAGGEIPGWRGGDLDAVPVVVTPGRYWAPQDVVDYYGEAFLAALYPGSVRVDTPQKLGLRAPGDTRGQET